jgi:hypothetical protein
VTTWPPPRTCPEAILASIRGTQTVSPPKSAARSRRNAADCRACRAELAFVRGDEEPAIELPDVERVYARVLERITAQTEEEAAERRGAAVPTRGRSGAPGVARRGDPRGGGLGHAHDRAIWVVRVAPTYETAGR